MRQHEVMPAFLADKKDLETESALLNDPLYFGERAHLIELIALLQRARSPEQYIELHRRLFVRFRARQEAIGELGSERGKLLGRRAELVRQDPKPLEELKKLQPEVELREHQMRVQKALQHAFLSIGDGIAWRALDYDRAAITVLGEGKRVAYLSEGAGWEAEKLALATHWDEGTFAIHNDMTTCLRHGDLTVFGEEGRILTEVKAGEDASDPKQGRRLRDVTELLNRGEIEKEDGTKERIARVPVRYRTYLSNLADLLRKAQTKGVAAGQPSSSQLVVAFDLRRAPTLEKIKATQGQVEERSQWFDGSEVIFRSSSAERRMRDRRHSFPTLAPLSIFPFDPEAVADLILGYLSFFTHLNLTRLKPGFERKGIKVRFAVESEAASLFFEAEKQVSPQWALAVHAKPPVREQMLIELMTPASLVAAVSNLLEDRDNVGARNSLALSDEAATWERQP